MSDLLVVAPESTESAAGQCELTEAQVLLKQMVLDSVTSPNTRRSYALTLDELFTFSAGRPLTRALLHEWKASMDALAPSTINVKLSAVRRLVGEARRNGLIAAEEAANLSDIPNVRQRGNRLGNWLTREQAKELLQVPASLAYPAAGTGTTPSWRYWWAVPFAGASLLRLRCLTFKNVSGAG